jgi:hypothetical protein
MLSSLYQSSLSVAYQCGYSLYAHLCCCSPGEPAEEDLHAATSPSAALIERTEVVKKKALNSPSANFKVQNTWLSGAHEIRYCRIGDQIKLMGVQQNIAEWKVKEASLPIGKMPASIELSDTGIDWLPKTFCKYNFLRATDQHLILANNNIKSDLAIFDRVSHELLKSITLDDGIVKIEVDRDELFVFTLDLNNLRNWKLHCYDLSHLETPPRSLSNIFCHYLYQVFFTDKEIILNLQSCFADSKYQEYYLIAFSRYFDDAHTKLFNDADTQLNFGHCIQFKVPNLPFLVPYKDQNHFIACFFCTEYDSSDTSTRRMESADINERNFMQAMYISISSNSIQQSFLFELNQKVWRNFTNCVGLCGDKIFVMGDAAYVVGLNSKAIEAIIPLQSDGNGNTEWQFLSIANRVSYLYSSLNGPVITTIDINAAS